MNKRKQAITELSSEERQELVNWFTPRQVAITKEEANRIKNLADAVPEGKWVKWEDLKAEFDSK
ncbi:MAG: hypothetical protein CMO80_03010 [Verrucomicrobiales bacterium]|nr:hypothetical protein [Verrucomicrobiales bacterium]